jgi:hypothetical protein
MLKLDLEKTPIGSTLWAHQCDVHEDRNNNLWIRNRENLFRVERGILDTTITTAKEPVYECRKLRIAFAGTSDRGEPEIIKYSWRLDDSKWSQPADADYVELLFDESGFHNFQVMAVSEMGNVDATPAALKLNIVMALPEVKIVAWPQETVEGYGIVIEYEVVKRREGSRLSFQWRLDEAKWTNTLEYEVHLPALEDGKYVFEVRAIEDDKYVQATPAKVEFMCKTDFSQIIAREIGRLKSDNYAERDKAARALVSIGQKALPYLRQELTKGTVDTQWWLKNVIWQIEKRARPD